MPLKKQVMIVDEDKASRESLRSILSAQYRVLEAESGIAAVPFLRDQRNEVSLILLDIMIRGESGADFLDQIMRDPEMALIPVIVTTKEPNKVEEGDVLDRGAAGYVSEPYNPKIVRSRVARLISLRENAAIANYYRCDQLTGLYSKELFYQKAQRQIQAYPDREYTVICSNVENFKLFNDVFGHSEGDRLLKKIAGALQKLAGAAGICGRLGSDRFLILLSEEQRSRDYSLLVETVDKALKKYSSKIVKWGIYEVTDTTVSVEQMCDRALMAGDSIKGQYTARFAVYDDTLHDKLLREQHILGSVETALREKQFTVYLQPKFRLSDDRLAGAEALVRWKHPQMGVLPPGEFIPLLEKKGFITQLDQYVWEQACRMLRDWKARGRKLVPISVNVSRADIYQSEFPNVLLSLVRKYHVDPEMLHLEITESAYAENLEQIIEAVDQLRQLGFSIEMDDFGSGYSSLNMLSRIKVDILKLDLKFIQNETVEAGSRGILHLVVELARKMNMRVVAEGVETQEQLRYIREAGCDYVQGYLFAKPMPDTEFEKYLHGLQSKVECGDAAK